MKKNDWRGWERPYQGGEHQIATWDQDFHRGEIKSPWKWHWNRELFVGERDKKWGIVLEREGHGSILETSAISM
jgi:hypothetical protein